MLLNLRHLRSPKPLRNNSEVSNLPNTLIKLPAPDLPVAPDTTRLTKESSQTASVSPSLAPSQIESSPGPTSPSAANAAKPLTSTAKAVGAPTDNEASSKPVKPASADPAPPAAAPPALVASLPSRVDAGSSLRNDDHPSRTTQEESLQPIPELAEDRLHVSIGQISADPHATDVHVVVVNTLQHEINDLDVRCRAHDAEGLQVAEASAHIASIAPSDVAFGQVLFPSEITTRDNRFTCDVGRDAAADTASP